MLAAVALIDVSDHLVAALALEVQVDVRGRIGAIAEEPFEQQIVLQRIHRRDAQEVGHQRIGRRPAALATDAARTRLAHDVPDDQKVVGQSSRLDHGQLVGELLDRLWRDRARFGAQTRMGQGIEVAERGLAGRDAVEKALRAQWEGRQAPAGEIQKHFAPFSDDLGGRQGIGALGKERGHLPRVFQKELAVRPLPRAQFDEGHVVAGGGQHIVEAMAVRRGVMDIVRGDHARADGPCD